MLFNPTMPGMYMDPSMALDNLIPLSNFSMCSFVNVGLSTYLMSFSEESARRSQDEVA